MSNVFCSFFRKYISFGFAEANIFAFNSDKMSSVVVNNLSSVKVAFFLLFFFVSISYSARTVTFSNSVSGHWDNWAAYFNPSTYCKAFCSGGKYVFEGSNGHIFLNSDIDCPSPSATPIRIVNSGSASCTLSGSATVTCENVWDCMQYPIGDSRWDAPGGWCDYSVSETCSFVLPVDDVIPPCSDLLPISAPECKGGQGLWFASTAGVALSVLAPFEGTGATVHYFLHYPPPPNLVVDDDTTDIPYGDINRPDGSQCNLFNQGSGAVYDFTICPQGWEETCEENPNQLHCQSSSSTSEESSSDSNQPSSSSFCHSMVDGICMDRPDENCKIMIDGICMDTPDNGDNCKIMINGECVLAGSSGSSGDGDGDWAKENIQIVELKVATEIRDAVGNLIDNVGHGISSIIEAVGNGINSIIDAISSAVNGIVNGIGNFIGSGGNGSGGNGSGGGSSGSGGDGSGGNGSSGSACLGYEFECNGGGLPSGTCDPRVRDCTQNFPNDFGVDTTIGITRTEFNSVIRDLGLDSSSHMSKMSRIMSDTAKVFPSMRQAIAPFNDYINRQSSGCNMTIDLSFNFGGFSCGEMCIVDLNNFGGKPIGNIISDIFTIAFGLGVLIRLMYVIRTIGQST